MLVAINDTCHIVFMGFFFLMCCRNVHHDECKDFVWFSLPFLSHLLKNCISALYYPYVLSPVLYHLTNLRISASFYFLLSISWTIHRRLLWLTGYIHILIPKISLRYCLTLIGLSWCNHCDFLLDERSAVVAPFRPIIFLSLPFYPWGDLCD